MANTIAKQVLLNGSKTYIMKLTIIGDGSGEETATLLNAVAGDMGTSPQLMRIEAELAGFSARLLWDATTPLFTKQLVTDCIITHDFTPFGGIPNNAGTGKTGDLKFTTAGLGAGDSGSIIIWMNK